MTQTPVTPTAADLKPPSLRVMIVGLLPSVFVNGVLVILIYQLVKHYTSLSDVSALFISAIPAMIGTIVSLLRQRRVDVLGAFALTTIAVSIVLTFVSGDARLFQIRESFLTVLFGIVCLISLLFPRPLWFYIIRYFTTGNNPQQEAAFEAAWQYPAFRGYIRTVTIVWGVTYAVEFVVRLLLVYSLPLSQFLIVSPIIFYGITIAVIAWTLRAGALLRKRGEARRLQETNL
ncbi:MAG TPA: VC0807 family protein [Ktedonobacteraceae bacterium]|nr:VC0807 family protein [Ktedonobacteraceae bacterium]